MFYVFIEKVGDTTHAQSTFRLSKAILKYRNSKIKEKYVVSIDKRTTASTHEILENPQRFALRLN